MSAQSVSNNNAVPEDNASTEGLDKLFSREFEEELERAQEELKSQDSESSENSEQSVATPQFDRIDARDMVLPDSPAPTSDKGKVFISDEVNNAVRKVSFRPLPEQKEDPAPQEHIVDATAQPQAVKSGLPRRRTREDNSKVARGDLVNILESFVNLIRDTDELDNDPGPQKVSAVSVDDKTGELEEMRMLLIEAQETIIKLLTDRVDDRSRLATLELQLKLLPDLQSQADRALAVAINTEDFRSELTKVKFELERFRLARVRGDVARTRRSWWVGVRGWLFKGKSAARLRNDCNTERTECT